MAQFDISALSSSAQRSNQNGDVELIERAGEALEVVTQLRSDFAERDRLYEDIDRVIFLENAVSIPEAYKATAIEVRSPLPLHITNQITSALSINAPTIHFNPIGFGEAGLENQALREEFFFGSWLRQEEDADTRIFRRFMHSLVTKGEAVLKTVEAKKMAWSGYNRMQKELSAELSSSQLDQAAKDRVYDARTEEFKRGAAYPIVSTDVPPESFYYIKGARGISFAAECKLVPYFDALVRYGAGLSKTGQVVPQAMGVPRTDWKRAMAGVPLLRMVEVWDWKECLYILQGPADVKMTRGRPRGLIVKKIRHGYGDPELKTLRGPYFHALGVTTSSREIVKQGLSVLFGYLKLFPLLDSLLTIQSQAAYSFGFPTYKRKTSSTTLFGPVEQEQGMDALEAESVYEEVVPGTIFPYDIEPLDQPRGGIDLDKTIAFVRSMLELALPTAAQGAIQGDQSGYAINQATHLARLAWAPIIDNAEFTIARRVGFESWLIENKIQENVYVWGQSPSQKLGRATNPRDKGWLGIGPQDLKGAHRYKVEIKAETPSNQIIELRTHDQMLNLRLEGPDDAITAMGNNPNDVKRQWLIRELENDPAIRTQLIQRTFKELATIDQKNMSGAEAPGAAPMVQPGPFAPTPQGALVPGTSGTPFSIGPAQMQRQDVPQPSNQPPGSPPGAPGGVRNTPIEHIPLPGEG